MKQKLLILAGCIFLLFQPMLCPAPAFMKLGDIKGEATAADHKEWIIIESMSSPIFRSGGSSSSATFEDIVVTKQLDKSSPKLAEAVANGTDINEATIVFTRSIAGKQVPYLQYKLSDVLVSSYSFGPESPTDFAQRERQIDSFSLNFEKIRFSYGGIRQTVIRYDANGNEVERVTVGLPTRLGGVVPPVDDVPPSGSTVDSMTISANEDEAVEQNSDPEIAG